MSLAAVTLVRRGPAASVALCRAVPSAATTSSSSGRAYATTPLEVGLASGRVDLLRRTSVVPPSPNLPSPQSIITQLSLEGNSAAIGGASKGFSDALSELGLWLTSTLKKRKTKMNKHKLQKRRKKARLKSK